MAPPTRPNRPLERAPWPPPAELDDWAWASARQTLLNEMAQETVFAPHHKLVVLRAFDRVRTEILSGRPLGSGTGYRHLRYEPGSRSPSERPELTQGPVERSLLVLFGAAGARQAEPLLDRRRVFSALPARPGEAELVAPDAGCAAAYRHALSAGVADTEWTHAVEIDVARAGRTVDRGLFLADLEAAGLRAEWMDAGRRLDDALARAIGPTGLPGSIGSGQMMTVALRSLDETCAALGVPSFRLIDGLVALVDGGAAAEAVHASLVDALARLRLRPNAGKTRIATREAFLAGWLDPAASLVDRIGAAPDPVAAARETIADLDRFGEYAFKAEQWALLALGRARDPAGIERAMAGLGSAPWGARIHCLYLGLFLDDRAVAERFFEAVGRRLGEMHPWQIMWVLAALWTAPAIPAAILGHLPRLAGDPAAPVPLRAAAAIVWSRIASRNGWDALEELVASSHDSHFRSAVAFGLRYRPPEARRTLLGRWARLDPDVDLVATALDRDLAGL